MSQTVGDWKELMSCTYLGKWASASGLNYPAKRFQKSVSLKSPKVVRCKAFSIGRPWPYILSRTNFYIHSKI